MDLPRVDAQVDVSIGDDPGEALDDVAELYYRRDVQLTASWELWLTWLMGWWER
jgi:hypothetical protein